MRRVPGFRICLFDLSQYADEQLVGSRLLRFGLSLLKYIFRRRELAARLEEFFALYRPLFSGTRWDFLWVALKYLTSTVPRLPRERLRAAVTTIFTEHEGVIMQTLAEEWMLEGKEKWAPQVRQEGLQAGRQEEAITLALRLLHKYLGKLSADTEQRIRALSVTQIEELVLTAPDLRTNKDLTAWLRTHAKTERE